MTENLYDIRKKTVIAMLGSKEYKPLKLKELAVVLQVDKEDKNDFNNMMGDLVRSGLVFLHKNGKYELSKDDIRQGVFTANARGFGFVTIEGQEEDIFIPATHVNNAMHKDVVLVKVKPEKSGARFEGEIVDIVERGLKEVIGTFDKKEGYGFVISDNPKFQKDIYITETATKGAVTGHKVVVELIDYGNDRRNPEGKITEIIGHIDDPGTDIMAIVRAFDLPVEFPRGVNEQLRKLPEKLSDEDLQGRKDIRGWQTVTIDGEDAKDLDDAITIVKSEGGYTLGVHIADVSHYVKERSALDKEALKRGTSVYLVDRVIPMLPHQLSNGICSLNEGVDRLTLSCIMQFDLAGNIKGHEICESVINSNRRMTYTSVKKILEDKDAEEIEKYSELVPMFEVMAELADILRKKRKKRGSLDFDFPEAKIIMDEKGKIKEIKAYERNIATNIIEEFMLIANETVAEDYYWQEIPFVYRTHDVPDEDKINKLAIFIHNYGYRIKQTGEQLHPKEIQKLLAEIVGTEEEAIISKLTLRSLKQARYSPSCDGHFGLAAKYYCHFTSPIRRYPDLQIHRIIKECLTGKMTNKKKERYNGTLGEVAKKASETERRAEEVERETEKLKKAEYMQAFIGKQFDGIISGTTAWGFYVELPNTVEGLVRLNFLNGDYFYHDEDKHMIIGEKTKKTFKLADRVRILVAGVDMLTKTVDFTYVEHIDENGQTIKDDFYEKNKNAKFLPAEENKASKRKKGSTKESYFESKVKKSKSEKAKKDKASKKGKGKKTKH